MDDPLLAGRIAFLFISPPSMSILEKRLRNRGTETEDKLIIRLKNAETEMAEKEKF